VIGVRRNGVNKKNVLDVGCDELAVVSIYSRMALGMDITKRRGEKETNQRGG
jgi:hypothetical protein